MKLDDLIATAKVIAVEPLIAHGLPYVHKFALGVIDRYEGPAGKVRAELLAWAKKWRDETCDRVCGCEPSDGSHGDGCQITRNAEDGAALVDALALAEHEEAKSQ